MAKTRFQSLDGLRGVCALSVVLLHSELLFNTGAIFCHGYLAVDMFFVLSGFVISASYDDRLAAGLGSWQFLVLRLRRLAPVYWTGVALCVAAGLVIACYHPAPMKDVLLSGLMAVLLLPAFNPLAFAYPANPVAWSLVWEILVNVAYAKVLRRVAAGPLVALIVLLMLGATAESFVNPRGWSFGMTGADIWLGGLRALPEFLTGVLLYRGFRKGLFTRLPAMTPLLPVAAWLALAVLPQGLSPLLDCAIAALACPLLVAVLVRNEAQTPAWFGPLGAISYPLYASHLALIWLAQRTPLFGLDRGPSPVLAIVVVGLAVAVAWVIHRFCDPAGTGSKGPSQASFFAGSQTPGACLSTPDPV